LPESFGNFRLFFIFGREFLLKNLKTALLTAVYPYFFQKNIFSQKIAVIRLRNKSIAYRRYVKSI